MWRVCEDMSIKTSIALTNESFKEIKHMAGKSSTAPLDIVSGLIEKAKAYGADAADALIYNATGFDVSVRMGEVEEVERAEGRDLGLRVFVGNRPAVVSSNDWSPDVLDQLVERAVAMAKMAPEDPYAGLADSDLLATQFADFDMDDGVEETADALTNRAREAEDAARSISGITNSEGGAAGFGQSEVVLATSNGFVGQYSARSHNLSVSVLAGSGQGMERDYDYDSKRHLSDLRGAADVGKSAGERTIRRLNPQKPKTQAVPVVFDERASRTMIGHMLGAINGVSITRGTSFLKDAMGTQIFASGISIREDPHRMRGSSSKPFDGEGVSTHAKTLIDQGVLQTWILDCGTAKQLGLKTTGNAARGTSGGPSPSATNTYMAAGDISKADLLGGIKDGLYVTELIGMGVNGVTGDYSRGASGFWIKDGELTHAVSEITIASNLKDMFLNMTAADDLEFRYGTDAPTLMIEGMTLAGS
jgi:PmbA protein